MVNFNSHKSFTLIETLIVGFIIVVLSGMSLAIFTSYKDDKVLNAQVSLFTRTIELVKNMAAAGDVTLCSENDIAHINGYSLALDPTGMKMIPGCDTEPTPFTYPIPLNIEYITPTFALRFDNLNYRGESRVFPIMSRDTNKCKYVRIDETGLVTNGDCESCALCPTP